MAFIILGICPPQTGNNWCDYDDSGKDVWETFLTFIQALQSPESEACQESLPSPLPLFQESSESLLIEFGSGRIGAYVAPSDLGAVSDLRGLGSAGSDDVRL